LQGGSGVAIAVVVVPSMPTLRVTNTVWLVSSQGEVGVELGIAPVALMSTPTHERFTRLIIELSSPINGTDAS